MPATRPIRLFATTVLLILPVTAWAQPTPWIQGVWKGSCSRGAKSINAQLVLAYSTSAKTTSGTLNGKSLAALSVTASTIEFTEGTKSFKGSFSSDMNQLTAELDKEPKRADCKLTRTFSESDALCLYNNTSRDQFIWLNSPNGSGGSATFILRTGQYLQINGDRTGSVCTSRTDFKPPPCPGAEVAQKSYSCQ